MSPSLETSCDRRTLLKSAVVLPAALIPLVRVATDDHGADTATPSASPVASPLATMLADVHFTQHLRFDPEVLKVAVGNTVVWTNDSPAPHTVTCDPAKVLVPETADLISFPDGSEPWASELLYPDESFEHTFAVVGTYTYICVPHIATGMLGTVIVE